jgi:tyrosyl-tRNA synthetase
MSQASVIEAVQAPVAESAVKVDKTALTEEQQKQYELIVRDLQEVIAGENHEEIKRVLRVRPLRLYWGTSTTGIPHCGYILPALKIADLLDAGCEVTILLADLHAYLDAMKSTLKQLESRTKFYEIVLIELLKALNVDVSKLKFVVGTSFQLSREYTMDVYKANTMMSLRDAVHSGAEVVKQSENPMITSLLYPSLQALDEQYLGVDGELEGLDQRKLAMNSRSLMPQLGYKKRFHLFNPMVPALSKVKGGFNGKMSSSDAASKIGLTDTAKEVRQKVATAYCDPDDAEDNTPLIFMEKLGFKILRRLNKQFIMNRPEQYGGKLQYDNFESLKEAFKNKAYHPADLKTGISDLINELLEPIRAKFSEKEMKELTKKAY